MNEAMERNDGFPRPRRARNSCGTVVIAFYQLSLCGVQENRPFFPRVFESPFQLFKIIDKTETALGIRMLEGFRCHGCQFWLWRNGLRRQVQQGLSGLFWKMIRELQ